jgi:tetratricopeptide (TPR) repeat protein
VSAYKLLDYRSIGAAGLLKPKILTRTVTRVNNADPRVEREYRKVEALVGVSHSSIENLLQAERAGAVAAVQMQEQQRQGSYRYGLPLPRNVTQASQQLADMTYFSRSSSSLGQITVSTSVVTRNIPNGQRAGGGALPYSSDTIRVSLVSDSSDASEITNLLLRKWTRRPLDRRAQDPTAPYDMREAARLYALGVSRAEQKEYREAEDMFRRVFRARRQELGHDAVETLTTGHSLGQVLGAQGKHLEAKDVHQRVWQGRVRVLGSEHPDAMTSAEHTVHMLAKQGHYAEAEPLALWVYKTRERVLGMEAVDTLVGGHYLGEVLAGQARFNSAEAVLKRVWDARRNVLGNEHLDTLSSGHTLAAAYRGMNNYREADRIIGSVYEAKKRVLGKTHPSTLSSGDERCSILVGQGRWSEARRACSTLIKVREEVLGKNAAETLRTAQTRISILTEQGNYRRAEYLQERLLLQIATADGVSRTYFLENLHNLGTLQEKRRNYPAAEATHRQAFEERRLKLGEHAHETLDSGDHLSLALELLGKYQEAVLLSQWILDVKQSVFERDNPGTISTTHSLGRILIAMGRYEEAELIFRDVFTLTQRSLGSDHQSTIDATSKLGETLVRLKRYKEAEVEFRKVWEARQGGIQRGDVDKLWVATVAIGLGWTLENQGRYRDAEVYYKIAYDMRKDQLTLNAAETLEAGQSLARVRLQQKKYKQAMKIYNVVWETRKQLFGAGGETFVCASELIQALEGLGKYREAMRVCRWEINARRNGLHSHRDPAMIMARRRLSYLDNQDDVRVCCSWLFAPWDCFLRPTRDISSQPRRIQVRQHRWW